MFHTHTEQLDSRPEDREDRDVGGCITLRWTFLEIGLSIVDWIGLAQDRYRWRALVNTVVNLWVP
jgi:hypothetical protein